MSDSTPVKNILIPAVAQMMSVWLVNDGCDFVKLVKWCLISCVLPLGSDAGLQLPFAIVANLEKNIELVTMALQLAKTLAPWYQPQKN